MKLFYCPEAPCVCVCPCCSSCHCRQLPALLSRWTQAARDARIGVVNLHPHHPFSVVTSKANIEQTADKTIQSFFR